MKWEYFHYSNNVRLRFQIGKLGKREYDFSFIVHFRKLLHSHWTNQEKVINIEFPKWSGESFPSVNWKLIKAEASICRNDPEKSYRNYFSSRMDSHKSNLSFPVDGALLFPSGGALIETSDETHAVIGRLMRRFKIRRHNVYFDSRHEWYATCLSITLLIFVPVTFRTLLCVLDNTHIQSPCIRHKGESWLSSMIEITKLNISFTNFPN